MIGFRVFYEVSVGVVSGTNTEDSSSGMYIQRGLRIFPLEISPEILFFY